METIAGKVKCLRRFRGIESGQNILDSVKDVASDLAAAATLEKPFQAPVLKAQDHFEESVQ
jgi:hypothetical protein